MPSPQSSADAGYELFEGRQVVLTGWRDSKGDASEHLPLSTSHGKLFLDSHLSSEGVLTLVYRAKAY